jgi:hypothetical protein
VEVQLGLGKATDQPVTGGIHIFVARVLDGLFGLADRRGESYRRQLR